MGLGILLGATMKTQLISDRFAMTLSMACLVHCLFAPSLIIFSYSFLSLSFESELIHTLILLVTVPISILALSLGYKNHKSLNFILIGILGMATLIYALVAGENILGESGELTLTMIGSLMVIYCHYRNYQMCQQSNCDCHETSENA